MAFKLVLADTSFDVPNTQGRIMRTRDCSVELMTLRQRTVEVWPLTSNLFSLCYVLVM
jgi:hypothetical protein